MGDFFGQQDHRVRMDWGPVGARATAAEVAVVVDVLSFSTSVVVAAERGMRVLPHPWKDARASDFARRHDAVLAVGRLEATRDGAPPAPSLSPAGLLTCEPVPRLVLPSPNGSTISAALRRSGATVAVGCLRNATAVGRWLRPHLEQGRSVAVVAAGERWGDDDSLRPALEDQLGAGAVLAGLVRAGLGRAGFADALSPEAQGAMDLFVAARSDLARRLHACVGGRELAGRGFAADVDVAADLDASTVVPVLCDGAFTAAGGAGGGVSGRRR